MSSDQRLYRIKQDRKPGISFVVRCRNEEKYIKNCITSLTGLTVPYEIVVVLHKCTDGSKKIVKGLKEQGYPIKIVEYNHEVSKAGYETLVTPASHPASLMTYYNFCFGHAKYNWIMKWDADFKCSKELLHYLNHELDISNREPTCVRIGCRLGKEGVANYELYLTNTLLNYVKHIFWEVPYYAQAFKEIRLDNALIFSISSKVLKPYWKETPWFMNKTSYNQELRDRYLNAVQILGEELPGLARASNEACDEAYAAVLRNEKLLNAQGIELYS